MESSRWRCLFKGILNLNNQVSQQLFVLSAKVFCVLNKSVCAFSSNFLLQGFSFAKRSKMEDKNKWINIAREYMALNVPDDADETTIDEIKKLSQISSLSLGTQDPLKKQELISDWKALHSQLSTRFNQPKQ